ncbi:MAG: RluA family pseudouridine synthase [Candidatus Aminicenantaceae bacterium]
MPDFAFLVTDKEGAGQRIDAFLAANLSDVSRARVQRLITQEQVQVDGDVIKASHRLVEGERVTLHLEPETEEMPGPEDIQLKIIHEDRFIIVVDKPSGLVVHPGAGRNNQTLVNGLLFRFPELAALEPQERPGIVHRLDKETSGVMVVARSPQALSGLREQFKEREVDKRYLALVWAPIRHAEGRLTWPIGRHARHRERISIKTKKPREAETLYRLLRAYEDFSYLEIHPLTGRTHQIRVHMAAAGHPLVGDRLYGRRGGKGPSPRLFLHAGSLGFRHPGTGENVKFTSPLPPDLQGVLDRL